MIVLRDRNKCTGCTACAAACPLDCIAMTADKDGFPCWSLFRNPAPGRLL